MQRFCISYVRPTTISWPYILALMETFFFTKILILLTISISITHFITHSITPLRPSPPPSPLEKCYVCLYVFVSHFCLSPGNRYFSHTRREKKAFLHEVGGGKTFFSLRRDKHFLLEMVVAMMRFMVRKRRSIGAIRALKFQ